MIYLVGFKNSWFRENMFFLQYIRGRTKYYMDINLMKPSQYIVNKRLCWNLTSQMQRFVKINENTYSAKINVCENVLGHFYQRNFSEIKVIYFHCRKEITSLVMLSIFCHLNKSENVVIKCSAKLWYISASRRVRTIHSSKTARAYTYLSESDFGSGEKSKEGKTYWVLFKNGNFYTICISKH